MRTLDGKVVAITGAGSGIGRALALAAASRGSFLALSDVDEAGLDRTRELTEAAGDREVTATVVDVADHAAVVAWADEVAEHFGRVDVVVNNAGVALVGDLWELEPEQMEWIMGINFWGVVHGTRAFLPHLVASGDGHVVNLSSLFGLVPMPGQGMYNASKFAVRGFSEALRTELLVADRPVSVTVVHPGGVRTAIARSARAAAGVDQASVARFFDQKLARTTPERAAQVIWQGVLAGMPRVLVGADAHVVHQLYRLAGARYQDLTAALRRRVGPR